MEEQKINPIALIITGLALIIIAVFIIRNHGRVIAPTTTPVATDQPSQDVCYYLNQASKGGVGNDIAYMKLSADTTKGTAQGELTTELAEKDTMKGTISGTFTPDTSTKDGYLLDGQYVTNAEGMNNTVEQLVRFDSTNAQVGYGEMVQNTDGTYSYKDKGAVNFSVIIPRVDCANYDSLKMVMQD